VDIPWLCVAGRANFLRKHVEPLSNRLLANTRFLCEMGSALAPLVNLANVLAPSRRFMEKAIGLDRRRFLPSFQRRTLRKILKGRIRSDGKKKIVMFLGCYTNFNDPEGEGLATLKVIEANNVGVLLPDLSCCGIARVNSGAINRVMEDIRRNVEMLASYVERDLDIVFSEPSCALAVKMEYPKILDTETSRTVADRCYDIHQYLTVLARKGELNLDLRALDFTVGYHNPCHLRALGVGNEVVGLLERIPGVCVREYSDGCCGLGGTFGMKKDNFDLSMEVGKRLFQEINDSQVDEIVTSCGACAMQIFQGTHRRAIHPVSLLAFQKAPTQIFDLSD
jgi:glycerol-3-phosphate dehydrogenase subunit C